ncbi:uncharacterized protein CELE_H06I04.1 [Caenorhabditis elegans]|nr:uncharacterized protein CELE_H06I04.1 [Caenorhabditis elegans]CTQ86574.1 C. elegans CEntrosomal Protein [Caenorhabditis elegans]|eukprot:NP_001299874.1 Uncharacterized protein CELE_H06I04.1 [Caenorhabditis elegans]
MYLNGNNPYYGGFYANNRYLFPSTSSQATCIGTSSEDSPPPPPPSANGSIHRKHHQNANHHQNSRHAISDTVAVAGDDLSNVPAAVVIQLEKANRTIASQTLEIERLKSYQNQNLETHLLKKQIHDLEKEVRSGRSRFLEQQELLAEMSREMDILLREKLEMQRNSQELEKKYKKAKFASRELAKILENDLCGTPTTSNLKNFESDDEFFEEKSLFEKSRALSRQQIPNDLLEKTRKIDFSEAKNAKNQDLIDKLIDENENLQISLNREQKMTSSLQDDLEKSRRMVIDRDEHIEELKMKLGKAETKASQCESDLTQTSSDLAMERLRCEVLTGELHEIDGIFRNTQSTIQAYADDNDRLEDQCRQAQRTILTLNSKLEAQGIDLVTTKRTLRALRETNEARSGPF